MSSTDVTGIAGAVSGLHIEGPPVTSSAKIELDDETLRSFRPGEIDPLVGANQVPAMRVESSDSVAGAGMSTAHVVGAAGDTEPEPDDDDDDDDDIEVSFNGGEFQPLARTEALFNIDEYGSGAPRVDGYETDALRISFSGTVELSPHEPEGRALFAALRLGKKMELRVAGHVQKKQASYKAMAKDVEWVIGQAAIKVDSLWVLAPEDLT